MTSKKLPSMQWYPGDWRKDPGVQSLSLRERGAWWEILQLMWESPVRGLLLLPSGQPMPDRALARVLGEDPEAIQEVVQTLELYGVADRDEGTGALMNRRMYREDEVRRKRAKAGRKGGSQKPSKPEANPEANPKQKPSKADDVENRSESNNDNDTDDGEDDPQEANPKQNGSASRTRTFSSSSSSPSGTTTSTKNATQASSDPNSGKMTESQQAMAEDLERHLSGVDPPSKRKKLEAQARMVLLGEDRKAWEDETGKQVPDEQRPELFRLALGYHADGTQDAFRSSVRYVVRLYCSSEADDVDPSMSPADRKLVKSINDLRNLDLEASAI